MFYKNLSASIFEKLFCGVQIAKAWYIASKSKRVFFFINMPKRGGRIRTWKPNEHFGK